MIIIVKPNVIYMTHQLIARKRIQDEEKRKHPTSRKRKYNLWDLENAAGYCSSTAQHSALYVNWNNIWFWQHSFSRRLYVIESPRIHFSFGFFDLFDWESLNTPRCGIGQWKQPGWRCWHVDILTLTGALFAARYNRPTRYKGQIVATFLPKYTGTRIYVDLKFLIIYTHAFKPN